MPPGSAPGAKHAVRGFESSNSAGILGTDFEKGTVAQTPLGRLGQVDDIATVATFLASDDAKWVTGELLRAGGGLR